MVNLSNQTPFAAHLSFGGVVAEEFSILNPKPVEWKVQVVLKATFALNGAGVTPASEQIPIRATGGETPDGFMETDTALQKAGVDLVIVGQAHAHNGSNVREMHVTLQVGKFMRALKVTGDRFWKRRALGWRPSDPAPFEKMPMTYERAFGGISRLENGSEFPITPNPGDTGGKPRV